MPWDERIVRKVRPKLSRSSDASLDTRKLSETVDYESTDYESHPGLGVVTPKLVERVESDPEGGPGIRA